MNYMKMIADGPASIDIQQGKLLIDGQWVNALSGATLPVVDPTTGRQIAAVAAAEATDVERAVVAARAAFRGWKRTPPAVRAKLLWRVADLIEENAEEPAHIEALNTGMPINLVRSSPSQATGLYRVGDPLVPMEQCLRFIADLTDSAVDWEILLLGGVGHIFSNPDAARAGVPGIAYDVVATQRAWSAVAALLAETLDGAG